MVFGLACNYVGENDVNTCKNSIVNIYISPYTLNTGFSIEPDFNLTDLPFSSLIYHLIHTMLSFNRLKYV